MDRYVLIDPEELRKSLQLACKWLVEIAQVKTEGLAIEKNSKKHLHQTWKGSIRGEYSVAKNEWDFFCPVWHTGQAIKALVAAYKVLGENRLLQAAMFSADFLGRERVSEKGNEHHGLIFAFEDRGDMVNTSAILECLDGLISLSEVSGDISYWGWVVDALKWVAKRAYITDEGLFRDCFSIKTWQFEPPPWRNPQGWPGRPLLDDGVFLKAYHYTGNPEFRRIFYETANRLLKEEEPPGNWIRFTPCNVETGSIHPRHAYWWGRPMLMAYRDSGEAKYLECAIRSGQWYIDAQRVDGGLFRGTYRNFKTDSFGHATSGIACASILWHELWEITGDDRWLKSIEKAMAYCMKMQFRNTKDSNLQGAILEKVLPPDGTDSSPYHIRDLGTIFFIQAASRILYDTI
ncbi:TPA: hypothetical protein GXX44_05560 [bacterium]|nr:hypothetical protein [bacterium]